jgi:HK97 family phage major capsid protein
MRRRAFPGFGPEIETRYERAGQWILAAIYENERAKQWCAKNGVPLRKAQGEGINSAGGFTVPTELSRAILDLREYYGAFRRRARLVPMASDNTVVARRTGIWASGNAGAYFMGENVSATEDTVNVDQLGLTAKKIGTLVRISSELEEDSASDIVDYVANEIAAAFAVKEDDCAFNGTGASTYGTMYGVSALVLDGFHNKAKVTAAAGHNTFLTLDATDIGSLIQAVQAAAIPNAAWFCSQTCFAQTFCRIMGTAGGGYLETREIDGVLTPCYLGFPVILTQKLPLVTTTLAGKVMLAFGDMYLAGVLGERRGITLARSAERYLDTDQIAVLGTQRFHSVIHGIGDNTNFGALAAIVGGA